MAGTGMMRRRVVLIRPAPRADDDYGDRQRDDGSPERYPVWASRVEKDGVESYGEEQEFGVNRVEFTLWWNAAYGDVSSRWSMEDEGGVVMDIVSVVEVGGRRNQLRISTVRRS